MIHRWVDLDANYARMVDLRRIIKYFNNLDNLLLKKLKKMKQSGLVINKELSEQNENLKRNIEDFLNEFQEYSGY